MSEKKTPMPCQDVSERIKNFDEVDFGYDAEQAKQIGRASCRERV